MVGSKWSVSWAATSTGAAAEMPMANVTTATVSDRRVTSLVIGVLKTASRQSYSASGNVRGRARCRESDRKLRPPGVSKACGEARQGG
jgi:hypothetical protein